MHTVINDTGRSHGMEENDTGRSIAVRPLQMGDENLGLLETLDALRPASGMSEERLRQALDEIISDRNRLVAVATSEGTVVGTATVLFERKIIHGGGMAGHIEDVAVRREFQARGVGSRLVGYLLDAAESRGCYKTVLDCEDGLVAYYENLGFAKTSNGMRYDHAAADGRRSA